MKLLSPLRWYIPSYDIARQISNRSLHFLDSMFTLSPPARSWQCRFTIMTVSSHCSEDAPALIFSRHRQVDDVMQSPHFLIFRKRQRGIKPLILVFVVVVLNHFFEIL
jgi:hypothetical protein